MAIVFGFNGTSTLDESAGFTDNDVNVNTLPSDFADRLFDPVVMGGLNLSNGFATDVGVAESPFNLITVSTDANIANLSLTQANGDPFDGTQSTGLFTLDGEEIFYQSDSDGQIILGVTAGGDVVFAVYLDPDVTGGDADVKLWTVTFEPIRHNLDGADPDDAVDLFSLVHLSVDALTVFGFDDTPSGKTLFTMVPTAALAWWSRLKPR